MSAKPILVIGRRGQLASELRRCDWPAGIEPVFRGSSEFDLSDVASIAPEIGRGHDGRPWAAVVNAAAYTAVDKAEQDPAHAWTLNALAPGELANACSAAHIPLVHFSTDYVFDGRKSGPLAVDDRVGPLNVYGASKLAGELAIRSRGVRHAIIRTSWVISAHGHNFVKTMLRLAKERPTLRIVADQHGSPTSAADLAQASIAVATSLVRDDRSVGETFHFSNSGVTTWAGLATEIFRHSATQGGPTAAVEPIATRDYPTPARRPQNSVLDHGAIRDSYGICPRRWEPALHEIIEEILGVQE